MPSLPPSITLEEHYTSQASTAHYGSKTINFGGPITSKLTSLSESRLKDMDSGNVGRQILSHSPFPSDPPPVLCTAINDELHAAIQKHPTRYSGFATLPMHDPNAAAKELTRCIKELGFVGTLVDCHAEGKFYDGKEYDVFWKTAEELDVPVYIHPCFASEDMMKASYRSESYGDDVAMGLSAFVFGWHVETGYILFPFFSHFLAGPIFSLLMRSGRRC